MPKEQLNISHLENIVHVGTHVEPPNHFYADGPGIDAIPLDRLMGAGVIISVDLPECGEIREENLARATPEIADGDIVAIHMGWEKYWGTKIWNRHPYLSDGAAGWLVEKKIRLVAIDTATPDMAFDARKEGFDFPVHRTLLKHGVLIAEQVANLKKLAGSRVEFMFCPVPIHNCDGAPARVLARKLQ